MIAAAAVLAGRRQRHAVGPRAA